MAQEVINLKTNKMERRASALASGQTAHMA